MELSRQDVETAIYLVACQQAPGQPLDCQRITQLLNERLAINVVPLQLRSAIDMGGRFTGPPVQRVITDRGGGRAAHGTPELAIVGKCRICGCTDDAACLVRGRPNLACAWVNDEHTLCDNPRCLFAASGAGDAPTPAPAA